MTHKTMHLFAGAGGGYPGGSPVGAPPDRGCRDQPTLPRCAGPAAARWLPARPGDSHRCHHVRRNSPPRDRRYLRRIPLPRCVRSRLPQQDPTRGRWILDRPCLARHADHLRSATPLGLPRELAATRGPRSRSHSPVACRPRVRCGVDNSIGGSLWSPPPTQSPVDSRCPPRPPRRTCSAPRCRSGPGTATCCRRPPSTTRRTTAVRASSGDTRRHSMPYLVGHRTRSSSSGSWGGRSGGAQPRPWEWTGTNRGCSRMDAAGGKTRDSEVTNRRTT